MKKVMADDGETMGSSSSYRRHMACFLHTKGVSDERVDRRKVVIVGSVGEIGGI